jgi:hypothetical protein
MTEAGHRVVSRKMASLERCGIVVRHEQGEDSNCDDPFGQRGLAVRDYRLAVGPLLAVQQYLVGLQLAVTVGSEQAQPVHPRVSGSARSASSSWCSRGPAADTDRSVNKYLDCGIKLR